MNIIEVIPEGPILERLMELSAQWEAEDSSYGYHRNGREEFLENRVFVAENADFIIGYLLGHLTPASRTSSVMEQGTVCFEVEELYVAPSDRDRGVGKELFRYMENAVRNDAAYLALSTSTKNWQAIFHFYLDELGMEFWNARLFKPLC